MRKHLLSITGVAALLFFLSPATIAQDKNEKRKVGDDEIIIRRKTDKDAKVTIEIKGDEVLVNGKPVDDYEGDDISIRKQHRGTVIYSSPFRNQDFNFNGGTYSYSNKSVAFLGVVTEKSAKGARIESVTDNSAAEKAGLKEGDVIVKIDDMTTEDADDVSKAIRKHKPEEKANIVYLRDGKENKVSVTLGKRKETTNVYGYSTPNFNIAPRMSTPNFNFDWKDGGGMGQSFAFGGRARLGIKAQDTEDGKGVKVLEVDEESVAEKAGVKEGDIITDFDGKNVNSADELAIAARAAREKNNFSIKVLRNGSAQTLEVKIPKKLNTTNL